MPRFANPSDEPASPKGQKPRSAFEDKTQPLLQARKVDGLTQNSTYDVTYRVLDDEPAAKDKDRRQPPRKRTRLRCGKILDKNGKFLIECQVHDRTSKGAHLRLMRSITLPRRIQYFDDEQKAILEAEIIWRRKAEIGVHFLTELDARAVNSGRYSPASGKYYAVV